MGILHIFNIYNLIYRPLRLAQCLTSYIPERFMLYFIFQLNTTPLSNSQRPFIHNHFIFYGSQYVWIVIIVITTNTFLTIYIIHKLSSLFHYILKGTVKQIFNKIYAMFTKNMKTTLQLQFQLKALPDKLTCLPLRDGRIYSHGPWG